MKAKHQKIRELELKCGLALAGESMSSVARSLSLSSTQVRDVVIGHRESRRVLSFVEDISVPVKVIVLSGG